MLATDKQIKYLSSLTNKVIRIASVWKDCGIDDDFKKWIEHVNWIHERSVGMTTIDASAKISAFHSLIRGINTKRALLGLKQF